MSPASANVLRVRRAYQSHLAQLLANHYRSLVGPGYLDSETARKEVRKLLDDWSDSLKHSGIPPAWKRPAPEDERSA